MPKHHHLLSVSASKMDLYEQDKTVLQNSLQLTQAWPSTSTPPDTYSISFEDHNDIKDEVPPLRHQIFLKQTIPSLSLRYFKKEQVVPSPLRFYPDTILSSNPNTNSLFAMVPEPYTQEGWKCYIHPEGLKYYYHPQHRVLTDANIQVPLIYARIHSSMNEFFRLCSNRSIDLPPSYEVVLELDDQDYTCGYYVVDNDRQTVFFLEPSYTPDLGLPDPASIDNLKLQLQGQYWKHVEYFPSHRSATKSSEYTLIAILSHAWIDGATSKLSTSPHSPEACKGFLEILKNFTGKSEQEAYRTCIIGRLMDEFIQARYINLYGEERGARLANNQSILPTPEPKSCSLYEITSVVLLRQPERELDILNNLWVDKIAYTASWRQFIRERIEEWKNVITIV
ncbi:hypothetical protein Clacol_009335 [Clathrus columnatus]|uniref:WW domain-containing protein n=1 Tax=Clathrus columnatus TaxID=1419009 RepID=A0AAV5AKW8_9AGAM|nr:hypothetical protein Clacol_009335 [Clathrus columnatus]